MTFRFYFWEDVLDLAVGADHEGGPGNTLLFFRVLIFFLDDTESFGDFLVGVGEQGKG